MLFSLLLNVCVASASIESQVSPFISEFEKTSRSTGTLLIKKGNESYVHAIGNANDSTLAKNSEHSVFLIASISKQITAAAILRLVDKRLLRLDEKVSDLFPELNPENWVLDGEPRTVHHLLSHTAGTPEFYPVLKDKLFLEPISMTDILQAIKGLKVKFEDGKKWEYSNTGYVLLGEVVRRKTGLSYSEYMKREFFSEFTSMVVGAPQSPELALSYTDNADGQRVNYIQSKGIKELHDTDIFTDGNIYSNIHDLANWTIALASGKLLSPAMTQKMFTPVQDDYAYGWIVVEMSTGDHLYYHSGSWIGYTGNVLHVPEKDITIVWLRNQEGDPEQNDALIGSLIRTLRSF